MNETAYSSLIQAAEEGNLLQVKLLLEQGAEPNRWEGRAALHRAIAQDHLEIAKLLIAAKADVNQPDVDGLRPLAFAKSKQAIDLLFAAGADPALQEESGRDQIDILANLGGFDLARYAHGIAETKQPGYRGTPLHAAACLRYIQVMQQLLSSGTAVSVVDRRGRTPLHWLASRKENEAAAQMILHHWAERAGGKDSLNLKASLEKCVQLLAEHGANIEARDAEQNTPLLAAMQWGQHETAHYLVQQGAQVAVQDVTGWTPVILAANTDDVPMLEFLLEHGGTLEGHRARWGPLNYAAHHGKQHMVRYLLDKGVDPNQVWGAKRLQLPIHSAAYMGHLEIVKMLLVAGAAANAQDGNGDTPLDLVLQQKEFKKRFRLDTPGPDNVFDKPWDKAIEVLKKAIRA